jgi:hypothetical protein
MAPNCDGLHNGYAVGKERIMSYSTDFTGHITVDPPLNRQEQKYLYKFAKSMHYQQRGNDQMVLPFLADGDEWLIPGGGRSDRWCQWVPDCNGNCITHTGDKWFYAPTAWLRFIIDHVLCARPSPETAGGGQLDAFTFDRVCNGLVAACRRDSGTEFLIRVTDNAVTEEALVDDDAAGSVLRLVGDPATLDRRRPGRRRRVRRLAYASSLVPLRLAAEADRE